MQQLETYVEQFRQQGNLGLARRLHQARRAWDVHNGGDARASFALFVAAYNWLGAPANKAKYGITGNLSRNLTGALMQDYLIHLVIQRLQPYPMLDICTEALFHSGHIPCGSPDRLCSQRQANA